MADQPRISTQAIDIVDFQCERKLFLIKQLNFKAGYAASGIDAIGLLQSMYYILPYSRHLVRNKQESESFISDLDSFRKKVLTYVRAKQSTQNGKTPDDPLLGPNFLRFEDYQELDNEFDRLVQRFYSIMNMVGFSA